MLLIVTVLALLPAWGRHPYNAFLPCKGRVNTGSGQVPLHYFPTDFTAAFRRLLTQSGYSMKSDGKFLAMIPSKVHSSVPASKKAIRVTDIPMNKKNIAGHNEN